MIIRTVYELNTYKQIPGGSADFILLSDLHACVYGKGNRHLISRVEECDSKIILFAGDMISDKSKKGIRVALELMEKLYELGYKIYYTPGNHEQRTFLASPDVYADFLDKVQKYVTLIRNDSVDIPGFHITGFDPVNDLYEKVYPVNEVYQTIVSSCNLPVHHGEEENINPENYSILLAHDPDYLKAYAKTGYDLVVSGHIHGGAVRLPFVGGVFSPRVKFFPKYDRGIYHEDNTTLVLSCGAGHHGLPFRMFNPAEVVEIKIKQIQ